MKKKLSVAIILFIAIGCTTTSSQKQTSTASEVKNRALRPYTRTQLSNGMSVILIEDRSLPYIQYMLAIPGGAALDSKEKPGVARAMADQLERGIAQKSANQIADELGMMASDFSASVESDYFVFQAGSLSKFQRPLLELFASILQKPTFPKDELDRYKKQTIAALEKRFDHPEVVADEVLRTQVYGDHKYGQSSAGTIKSVGELKREDLQSFYKNSLFPQQGVLAVVGSFSDDISVQLEQHFGGWKNSAQPEVRTAPAPAASKKTIVVDKEGLVQTQIRVGHLGLKRNDPDFFAVRIANTILGRGFESRLMSEIRVKSGLTYSIYSESETLRMLGMLFISTFTRNDKIEEMLQKINQIEEQFVQKGVTEEELQSAKSVLLGAFPQALETPERLAYNLLILEMLGVGADYLTTYESKVKSIALSEVNAAIRKHWRTNENKVIVFTDVKKVREQVDHLGQIEVIPFEKLKK